MLEVLHEVSPPPPRWNSVSHHCIICSRQSLLGPAESFHVHIHLSSWPRNHGESPCRLLGPPFSQLPTFKNAALPISAASIAQDSKFSINETTLYGFHFLAPPPQKVPFSRKTRTIMGQSWSIPHVFSFSQRSQLCATYYPMPEKICCMQFQRFFSSRRKSQVPITLSWLEVSLWCTFKCTLRFKSLILLTIPKRNF